ncbi:MAG: hypothetical protein K8F52_15855 [Candidatus Scalindua rubra]|nr:hypothetical protein [Candidatus Scalindua rubra]
MTTYSFSLPPSFRMLISIFRNLNLVEAIHELTLHANQQQAYVFYAPQSHSERWITLKM